MSQPNFFLNKSANNGEFLNTAYQFNTFCPYINNGLQNNFSSKCIFCTSLDSISLIADGSFRKCNKCNKQFKALFIKKN